MARGKLLVIILMLHITLVDSENEESSEGATKIRQVYITHDSMSVYVQSGGNRKLGLSNTDRGYFDVYSDGTMRYSTDGGCLKPASGQHVHVVTGCDNLALRLSYDSSKKTYISDEDCWHWVSPDIKLQTCGTSTYGFIQHIVGEETTTSTHSSLTQYSTTQQPKISSTIMFTLSSIEMSTILYSPHSSAHLTDTILSNTHSYSTKTSSLETVRTYDSSRVVFSSTSLSFKDSTRETSVIAPSPSTVATPAFTSIAVNNTPSLAINNLYLANPGQQCLEFCTGIGKFCTNTIVTGNSDSVFTDEGVKCFDSETKKLWKNAYDPSYHLNGSICAGYVAVNEAGMNCHVQGFNNTDIRRLCKCLTSGDEDNFSPWVPWSACTASCNGGVQTRTRSCTADSCSGETSEQRNCNTHPCPIHGGFSDWSHWSACSRTCGGGQMTRIRLCNNPYPQHGGLDCFGEKSKSDICNVNFCPVHGNWSSWTQWSACDKPCNTGRNRRWRFCNNPAPLYGGNDCPGNSTDGIKCNENPCPAENIKVIDVKFDQLWNSSMGIQGSTEFNYFRDLLRLNVRRLFSFSSVNSTYLATSISSLRQGSVVATFTLYFSGLDSFQILLLQEAIEADKYLGKLKIIGSNHTYNTSIVPGSPPLNFTLTPLTATSIEASWNEPSLQLQNGNISGYILFYKERLLRAQPYSSIATTGLRIILFGLKVFTEYTFRVLAYNQNGNGIATQERYVYTKELEPSQPPSSVSANGTSGFSAIVQWNNIPQDQWNGHPVGTLVKFDNLNGHNGNVTVKYPESSVILTSLVPVTTYVIDVCGVTAPGPGPCQRVQATTLPSAPSQAPKDVAVASNMWHNQMTVEWRQLDSTYVHGDLLGYKVLYTLSKIAGQNIVGSATLVKVVHPSLNGSLLSNLQPNAQYVIQVLAYNIQGDGVLSAVSYGDTCACPPVLYTNFAASAPYIYRDSGGNMQGLFANILSNLTQYTCGTCKRSPESKIDYTRNGKNGWAEKKSLREMKQDIDNYIGISFPAFGSAELTTYYGFPFVPVFTHPGVVYFIIKDSLEDQIANMMRGVLETWPIFAMNVLLLTIAGYIMWALEFGKSQSDFPDSCLPGVFDGMYWAYITMGTHGYGDLIPRGLRSRLFAVVWILIGMINMAIFTGALTTAITATQVYSDPSLYGVEVAAVHDSVAYKIGIFRNARVNTKENYSTVEEVAAALKRHDVRGAIVDIYSAAAREDLFKRSDIIAKRSIKFPSAFGFVLSGDMQNAAPQFRNYLEAQASTILSFIEKRTAGLEVNEEKGETVSLFDSESPLLKRSLIAISSLFVVGFVIGLLYTHWRRKQVTEKAKKDNSFELKKIETMCEESIANLLESWTDKVEKLSVRHMEARMKYLRKDKRSKFTNIFGLTHWRDIVNNRTKPSKETVLLGSSGSLDAGAARITNSRATTVTHAETPLTMRSNFQRPSVHSHTSSADFNIRNLPTVS